MTTSGYETVIGLELHAQLRTETKLFCRCRTRFIDPVLCQNSALWCFRNQVLVAAA